MDPMKGPVVSTPVVIKHGLQQKKLQTAAELFEKSPFNSYSCPRHPELLIITISACFLYSREAIEIMNLQKRVGILKLSCTWPLPVKLLKKYLRLTDKIMVVEEVLQFLEENIKVAAMGMLKDTGIKTFYGKMDKTLPSVGELNPDIVAAALGKIMKVKAKSLAAAYTKEIQKVAPLVPPREQTFCPGCPHRASFWNINTALKLDGREGIVCGDIG